MTTPDRPKLTAEEWKHRYGYHFTKVAGIPSADLLGIVEAGFAAEIELSGADTADWRTPEEAADDEMSYWDDDGGPQ